MGDAELPARGRLTLTTSSIRLAVCQLNPGQSVPGWATGGEFWTVTGTSSELSVVCELSRVPDGVQTSATWRALVVQGPLTHQVVGVLASVSSALARAEVPIFAISTYQTDWILVPEESLEVARAALRGAGHTVPD
ncbi:MAG TPA: ACT domain-containing protein [Candidatus Dormibacteraeota bacterium]|nr:ACT domain-containing protein [Candidatus Dormibacteraeota bacterium]